MQTRQLVLLGLACAAALILVIIAVAEARHHTLPRGRAPERFWTQNGGAIPPAEQARRFDAAEKGVPDMAWAVAYWPPEFCGAAGFAPRLRARRRPSPRT